MILCMAVAAALLPGHATPARPESPPPDSPNFVVFLTDDQGWGDLGCHGHSEIKTPNVDRFAEQGMRFTQCYAGSAVCSPSRSAILTGRTPYRNGVYRWIPAGHDCHLRTSEITIATLLKKRGGYATCHVGKWHLNGHFNDPRHPQPSDHGYDHWLATQNNAAPSHQNPVNFVRNGEAVGPLQGYSAQLVAEEAVRWLRQRPTDRPFFLSVWTHEPHLPIETDPRFRELYAHLEDADLRQHHGNISQVDAAFGTVLDALDELGLAPDTFVIYTSDNGPEGNGEKGRTRGSTGGLRGRKRSVYEGGIRVPGLMRFPGRISAGSVSDQPVIGSDVFATLCDLAGIAVPDDRTIDGASLRPLFTGDPIRRELPLYWRCRIAPGPLKIAMRDGDWKILASEDLTRFELYHLARDPRETRDLTAAEPERFEAMKRALLEVHSGVEAEGPDWWKTLDLPKPAPEPGPGRDESGQFDVVLGGTARHSGEGFELSSQGEALALWRFDPPLTDRATFELSYATARDGGTRNGAFAFGAAPTNTDTFKCGTGIGMGSHLMFRGSWSQHPRGVVEKRDFDAAGSFSARVTVDLKAAAVRMVVGGEEFTLPLPADLGEIQYYGYYAKGTATNFSPIRIER